MNDYYYEETGRLYKIVDQFLHNNSLNPCGDCNICCTSAVSQGVSILEFDYIKEFLLKIKTDPERGNEFADYVNKKKCSVHNSVIHHTCPFYEKNFKQCSIYSARPLSCRTYGYFVKSDNFKLLPDKCAFKKSVKIYGEENFEELLPFVYPFYLLIFEYDEHKKMNKS